MKIIIFDHLLVKNKKSRELFYYLERLYGVEIYTTSLSTAEEFNVNTIPYYSKKIDINQRLELWANSNNLDKDDFLFISDLSRRNKLKGINYNIFLNLNNFEKVFDTITKIIDGIESKKK